MHLYVGVCNIRSINIEERENPNHKQQQTKMAAFLTKCKQKSLKIREILKKIN